jgi:hypothetical protein
MLQMFTGRRRPPPQEQRVGVDPVETRTSGQPLVETAETKTGALARIRRPFTSKRPESRR